jgi:predicted enzyme related to lactoylglutathione lyase
VNLNSILVGTEDPQRLVTFYTSLFGEPVWNDGGYTTWQIGSGWITVGPHDQVHGKNAHPGRLIWNIETPDVKTEFDRFVGAGATVVQAPYTPDVGDAPDDAPEMLVATFSDPDDNYFQLVSPMPMEPPS